MPSKPFRARTPADFVWRLDAAGIDALARGRLHRDGPGPSEGGEGLYFHHDSSGRRRWVFITHRVLFKFGRPRPRRRAVLGEWPEMGLEEARIAAVRRINALARGERRRIHDKARWQWFDPRRISSLPAGDHDAGGFGLRMVVSVRRGRRWNFRFRWVDAGGVNRMATLSLGWWPEMSLATARGYARRLYPSCRTIVLRGGDPRRRVLEPVAEKCFPWSLMHAQRKRRVAGETDQPAREAARTPAEPEDGGR